MVTKRKVDATNWRVKHRMLSVFGDNKPHTYQEIEWLGLGLFSSKGYDFRPVFKKLLEDGLVGREWYAGNFYGDSYSLTGRGDGAIREWGIWLKVSDAGYMKNFDRTPESYKRYCDPIKGGTASI